MSQPLDVGHIKGDRCAEGCAEVQDMSPVRAVFDEGDMSAERAVKERAHGSRLHAAAYPGCSGGQEAVVADAAQ